MKDQEEAQNQGETIHSDEAENSSEFQIISDSSSSLANICHLSACPPFKDDGATTSAQEDTSTSPQEKDITPNERNVQSIIASLKITPETNLEELEAAFANNSWYVIPTDIQNLFHEFKMWRQGPGGAQVLDVTAEMCQQRLETMAKGMKISEVDDFWNSTRLWKYFFL